MTLQEFVRDSLDQITSGVDEARSKNRKIAPWVQPPDANKGGTYTIHDGTPAFLVDFDVAVTVSDTKGGGSGSISVAQIFSIEAASGSTKEQSKVSRITFSVPIYFTRMAEGTKDIQKDNAQDNAAYQSPQPTA